MAERMEVDRRVSRELEIAREVQAKLLPQDRPVLASLDYAGACLQARIVGGDYFDFVSLAPDQFGLVLADISGKGISAALLMASLQANLRAQYANAPHDLAQVLGTVNKIFFDSTASNHYATLFFGVYHETERTLRYANCGHLPPVLLRADGQVERLGVTAPVVGLFDTPWECATGETSLAAGRHAGGLHRRGQRGELRRGRRVRRGPADRAAAAPRRPARAGAARRHRRRRRRAQRAPSSTTT